MDGFARTAAHLILLACAAASGVASAGTVYEGTLGKSAIIAELEPGKDGTEGRYFYRRHRLDIPLEAQPGADGAAVMSERADWRTDDAERPRWTLRKDGDGRYSGQWRDAKGKTLPIVLRPVAAAGLPVDPDPALEALRVGETYDYLRLSGLKLVDDGSEQRGAYRLQWQREPNSGMRLFQVVEGYPAQTRERVNRVLHARLWSEVRAYYECLSGGGEGEYEQTVTVHRLDPKILSASVFTSYYCGGAHPDFGDSPINLDPRSGRELRLEQVISTGKPAPSDEHDSAWLDYRSQVWAPWLVAQFERLYPAQMKAGEGEDECDYADDQIWSFPSWYATDQGLYLGASFYRAARACDDPDWSVLPWSVVRQHHGAVDIAP